VSRFVFTTLGSLGDLHPYIAIARELTTRGHQAVLVTMEDYREMVEKAGIDFVPIPPSINAREDRHELIKRLFHVRNGPKILLREIVMPYLQPVYEQLMGASREADLLISHPLTVTLPLVAERRNLPWVSTVLAPMSFMSCVEPPLIAGAQWVRLLRRFGVTPYRLLFELMKGSVHSWEAPLRDFRRQMGFQVPKQLALFEGQYSPLLNLALFDPLLAQPQTDWPSNTRICGTPVFDGHIEDEQALYELQRFLAEGEPPIVFALGSSAVWIAGDFWHKAIQATQRLQRRAILLCGPHMPDAVPAGIKAFSYLPYSKVFPHAAAVVHQAGIGTLTQALRAGRPQLIVPVAFDQPDNADRAVRLGIARTLPFRKVSVQKLTQELNTLLSSPGYSDKAQSIADATLSINGAARAADELINCVQK
jgi:rhamnosyltransferase subunit B